MFPELRIQGFGNVMLEWARHVEDSGWLNNRLHSTQFNGETDTIYPDQKTTRHDRRDDEEQAV